MAMATNIRTCYLDMNVEGNDLSNFCTLLSEMPIRTLRITVTSLMEVTRPFHWCNLGKRSRSNYLPRESLDVFYLQLFCRTRSLVQWQETAPSAIGKAS
jgi:hypothetical protein